MNTNRVKSAISLLLVLCMLCVLAPPPAMAAEELSGKCGGDATWSLSSDGKLTISGQGDLTSGQGYDYSFRWPWHKYRDSIKTIEVQEGITSIGTEAFSRCVNVTEATLPGSLTTIKKEAFYGCNDLEEVTIPQGVVEIGEMAFCASDGLTRVFLPASIKKIGRVAFDYTLLQEVYYGGTEEQWAKVSLQASDKWHKRAEMHYNADALPPASTPEKPDVATDWYFLMAIFKNTDASATVDEKTYEIKNSLTDAEIQRLYKEIDIFETAMADTGLIIPHIDIVEVDAPITEMDDSEYGPFPSSDNVFTILSNQKVDLGKYDHVTVFGALTEEVPHEYAGITTGIRFADNPGYAFVEGNDHGKSYTERDLERLDDADTASVIVHELLHSMEDLSGDAFGLHAIRESFGTKIDEQDFRLDMKLVQNQIKSSNGTGVPTGTWTLARNRVLKAESLSIPDGTLKINQSLYHNLTNLKTVRLPDTVTEIEGYAFEGCKNLNTVYIPASVTSIGDVAFYKTGLKDVYYGGTEAQWKAIEIGQYNDPLTKANIHYNSVIEE